MTDLLSFLGEHGWSLLDGLCYLASTVCFVITQIAIFRDKEKRGILHGIIGFATCGLWTFIWGWVQNGRYGNTRSMVIWTLYSWGEIFAFMAAN